MSLIMRRIGAILLTVVLLCNLMYMIPDVEASTTETITVDSFRAIGKGAADDAHKYYMIIFENTPESTIASGNLTLSVDGVAKESQSSISTYGGNLVLWLYYDDVQMGADSCWEITEHLVTIKAGTMIGSYALAEDVSLKVHENNFNFVETITVENLRSQENGGVGGPQDVAKRYMIIFENTPESAIASADLVLFVDGVDKESTSHFDTYAGNLVLWLQYKDVQAGATSYEEITEHIVTIKAGNTIGNCILANDVHIKIDGSYISLTEKHDVDEEEADNLYDISSYRKSVPHSYPEQSGKLFAGWYTDAKFETPLDVDVTTGKAYAKFVDANMMKARAQATAGIKATSAEADIRFVATVDSLNYQEVGFVIEIEGKEPKTVNTRTVYEQLYVVTGTGVDTIKATEFSAESNYFFTYAYWGVTNDHFKRKFTVTPYYKTLDGTIVNGQTVYKTIANSTILSKEYTYTDDQRITPFWEENTMYNETMAMMKHSDGEIYGTLLFVPTKIHAIVDVSLKKEYVEGIDWEWEEGTNKIKWLVGSNIPYFTDDDLSGKNADGTYISDQEETEDGRIRFGNCILCTSAFLYEKQINVSYTYDLAQVEERNISATEYQGDKLVNTRSKLENNEDLKVLFYGDSIFNGCDVSSMYNREPYMPYMHELIRARLQQETSGKVTIDNIAVPGWLSGDGLNALSGTVQGRDYSNSYQGYDLLILSFGMNDIHTAEEKFKANIRGIVNTIKEANPNLEVIFVSCMNPNPRATTFCGNQQYQGAWYREMAAETAYADIAAVVDIYSVHKSILQYKSFSSTTGNNINHPNDWLIRVYAQNILAAMLQ